MLPLAFVSLSGLIVSIVTMADGVLTLQLDTTFIALLSGLISLVIFYIACTMLYRVTRRATDISQPGTPDSTQQADVESFACPKCSQSIPVGATQCPACGWSYDTPEEQAMVLR